MKRVVIVGGGVIGLCTAYYCARRGHHVTILEREPAQRDGCSFGNAGLVVPSHFIPLAAPGMVWLGLKWMWNPASPFYVQPRFSWDLWSWGWRFWRAANRRHVQRSAPLLRDLNFASRACFEELSDALGSSFELVKKGLLMLCRTQQALDDEARMAEQARALGVPAEVLDPQRTAQLDPGVTMRVAGSVYFPKDCHLSPHRFMAGLQQHLVKAGVVCAWSTDVTGFRREHARIQAAQTRTGEFVGDEFVLCGGSWSPGLSRELGLPLPMQPGKGYSLTLPRPPQLPQLCSIFTEARIAVTPMGDTLRFGGTMELAGLNEDINPIRVQGIIDAVPHYFPEFNAGDFAGVQPWRGLRPCSPDGLPYLGRTRKYENLAIATGHAMMGLSLGPITGRLISELITEGKPSLDLGLLDPDRYG